MKVLSLSEMYTPGGSRALVLKYLTDLSVDDAGALSKEAEEIWSEFQDDVERSKLPEAMLTALESPRGSVFSSTRGYTFVFRRSADGQWSRASAGK